MSLFQPGVYVNAAMTDLPATEYGKVIDVRKTELAPGAVYTWLNMENERGQQKIHAVEFDPKNPNLALRAGTKNGKVYGMKGVTEMAAYTDAPGSRVIAGINGDFYEISGFATGVPNGLFMDEGRILNSASSTYAFGLKADGSSIYGSPKLTKQVSVGGQTVNLTSINRYRDTNHLVLYTTDYNTSTKSTSEGDEIVLDIVEGEVKSGQTLKLKVAEVRKNLGDTPLAAGQVVLSASGTSRAVVANLQAGDEITASFALDGEWNDVVMAVGGQGPLVKDGTVQTNVGPAGIHPRTAIGTKADGSIVLFEIDGRAPGFSEGVETDELAKMLKDMGVVNAMNLDGGGSSTFVARMPGTSGVQMMNHGSDGYERKTGNGLLLVNTAPELTTASTLAVQPNAERILAGAAFKFTAAGIDANGQPAAYSGPLTWQVDPSLGTIDGEGLFRASAQAGTGVVTAAAGTVQGSGEIEVVGQLTELKFPDVVKTYTSGAVEKLSVTALREGQVIQAANSSYEWRVEGGIGTVDADGIFTATNGNGETGKIYVKHGNVEASFEVNVGLPPVILEDFEAGLGKYTATGAAANYTRLVEITDQDFIRNGDKALKLEYDFTGRTGTSGAYLTASSTDNRIQIPGYPEKIGMWVYGDGQKHWLRAQIRDGNNAAVPINFTAALPGVDWTGWRYVEADVPTGKATPLTMDMPVRYMETSNNNKTAGALYIDDIRAVYGPLNEDTTPPVMKDVYPADNEIVKTATPTISVTAEDAGYDPVIHPGTTLIDPDKTRVYVDGQLVEHGFYPPKGTITYKPKTALAEGRHKVKVAIRDLDGNQTIKEWYFMVNLGSPYYVYDTPETVYAGNTYTLDVRAVKANILKEGHIAFKFDPAAVQDLQVIRGDKVTSAQLEPVIDPAAGEVRLNLSNLNEANLSDSELIGQIRYTVSNAYVGPHTLEEISDPAKEVSKPLVIENTSGSVTSAEGTGTPINFVGAAAGLTVKTQLKLTWNHYDMAQGFPAAFAVSEMTGGAAVEGAKLLINGAEAAAAVTGATGVLTTEAATAAAGTYKVQAVKGNAYSPVMTFKVAPHAGTAAPRNINVTMGEDAETSRQLTWQTEPLTTETVVELVKASEFTDFADSNVLRITGTSSIYNTNNDGTVRVHKAEVTGLEPGTSYVYRAGDGDSNVSQQGTFRTNAAEGEATKFLFIGDSQADSQAGFALWGDTLAKAMESMPDADMLVHAGDMVDKGFEQEQWNWWFEAAQEQLLNTTLVPVIGNHEVNGSNGTGDYTAQFHNPQNGAASVKNTSFSFDIQDTHFVVLNTEYGSLFDEQAEWLDEDLGSTDKKWKVIFFHQGPYGSMYANQNVQAKWVPVFDQHGVDLVMNGHDHIYLRTYPMKGGAIVPEGQGTRYVIGGSSGPKFYALTEYFWQEKIDDKQEQIFTAVEITGDEINIVARTAGGREVDRFAIVKKDPETLILDRTSAEMLPGESLKLEATVGPEDASVKEVVWSVVESDPAATVTVDTYGLVTALQPGTATVRAAVYGYPGIYAESQITVKDAIQSLELQGRLTLKPGAQDQTVTEAVYYSGSRHTVTEGLVYASTDESVATVSDNGLVHALAQGSTVISVTYQDFSASYNLNVTLEDPAMTAIQLDGPRALAAGASGTAVVQAVFSDGSLVEILEGILYSTSDPSVAAIDDNGFIQALAEGTTVISAVYQSWSADYTLTVTSVTPEVTLEKLEFSGLAAQLITGQSAAAAVTAVYSDGTSVLVTGDAVITSSNPAVADIVNGSTVRALQAGSTTISISFGGKTLEFVIAVSNPSGGNPGPAPTPTPAPTPGPSGTPAPTGPVNTGILQASAEQLSVKNAAGEVVLTTAGHLNELILPGNAAGVLGNAPLRVEAPNLSLGIPGQVLAELSSLLPGGQLEGSTISLAVRPVAPAKTAALLTASSSRTGAEVNTVSDMMEFALTITAEDGTAYTLSQFRQPVSLTFNVNPGTDPELTGVYYIAEDGTLQYIGGNLADGKITASVSHFSKYAVLEYNKTFDDVRPGHWAESAVKQLAARQLAEGVSVNRFDPDRAVTRAEFTAMLVRALGLTGTGSSSFGDVAADKWYANDVALAVQAGLVNGRTSSSFAPDAVISRQEMAAMLVRSYAYAANLELSEASGSPGFTDVTAAPQWAQAAIGQARELGLMNGRTAERFAPASNGTRAESAQMILNLLDSLD
ncbi:phosphodiester glycosidase family protein [Paenibacillus sp. PK3_47]|uniref:phosphodiester glycosidase family protein n=1 Tax=Paenibacillus sp. PK3_47 TaxID=2072642 RepID=UPI00201E143B|nr:phosphodiester glycosidase family protein [Paenibacillus sp. PK3_47]